MALLAGGDQHRRLAVGRRRAETQVCDLGVVGGRDGGVERKAAEGAEEAIETYKRHRRQHDVVQRREIDGLIDKQVNRDKNGWRNRDTCIRRCVCIYIRDANLSVQIRAGRCYFHPTFFPVSRYFTVFFFIHRGEI